MEFDGALGEIEVACDFLVGKATKDAAEHFLFSASNLDFALHCLTGFKQLVRFFQEAFGVAVVGLDHDHVVIWRLAAHHAVHRKKACGLFHRQIAVTVGAHLKMGGTGLLFTKKKRLVEL